MWRVGEQVPFFEVTDLGGWTVRYRDLWQRRILLLVTIADPESPDAAGYIAALSTEAPALSMHDTAVVRTACSIASAPRPGVVIADRWGQIQHIAAGDARGGMAGLPGPRQLVEWLRYVQSQCPECQGETR